MILHDAAGPAVLAVNVLSPSSLLSSRGAPGPFAIVFAETGPAGQDLGALIAPPGAPPLCIRKPDRQDRPVDARPRMTVYNYARSGGRPKGARCLP